MIADRPFRAFLAVPLDPPVAGALEGAARGFVERGAFGLSPGSWRVVPAGRIHVTLKFLGDTEPSLLPPLGEALREAAAAGRASVVSFGGWIPLPGPRSPRVLAAGVSDPAGTLSRMAAVLEDGTAALGFPRERRGFLPHVTVARARAGRRGGGRRGGDPDRKDRSRMGSRERGAAGVPPGASLHGEAPETIATQRLGRLVLYRSTLGPGGPVYEVIDEAVLPGVAEPGVAEPGASE